MTKKLDWIKRSLMGSSTMLSNGLMGRAGPTPGHGLSGQQGGHVHGPHCNHGHDDEEETEGHVHGPGCNH